MAEKRVALHTLGCKLNFAETAALGRQFIDRGYRIVEFGEAAEVTVINTCTVTARANRECRQLIRRALRASPNSHVMVTGCYAQLEPEEIASIEGVAAVLGTKEKRRLTDFLPVDGRQGGPVIHVSELSGADDFGPAFSTTAAGRTRAYLKVQDGCDYTCSFCTIPLARGPSRSQSLDACVSQAKEIVAEGFREIVLTGVNVGDYGRKSGADLLALTRELVRVDGLERLRISSIEPNLLTDELLAFASRSSVLADHFHIPLQSGSDAVLRAMRRRYTPEDYRDLVFRIRDLMPECGIGVDVITGFPGETEEQFDQTCRFIDDLPVSYLHVFTYSERPNTPASAMAHQVRPEVRYRRTRVLRMLGRKKKSRFYSDMTGKTAMVLLEGDVEDGVRFGLTKNYVRVGVPTDKSAENEMVDVTITGAGPDYCTGEVMGTVRPAEAAR